MSHARKALCYFRVRVVQLAFATISAAVLGGCTSTNRSEPREKPQSATEKAPPANALPALQRARLEYLFEATHLVAKAWPWMTSDETCVLLVAPAMQWIVNCDEASASFSRVPDGSFRGRPVFARTGGTFWAGGRELSTQEFLGLMPATAHVDEPGVQSTDLPSRHTWLLLGSLEGLIQYHPAFEAASTEEWLSVAMHEFLHTQAMRLPSFATDLHRINTHGVDPKPLAQLYTQDVAYHALVEREYELLVRAALQTDLSSAEARRALNNWYRLYRTRRSNLRARNHGKELVEADSLFTYVEGVARYVESTFLIDQSQHPEGSIAGDPSFHGFAKWTGRGYAAMPNRQLDPEYYYALGFHLGLLLERIDPSWRQRVPTDPNGLIGIAEAIAAKQ